MGDGTVRLWSVEAAVPIAVPIEHGAWLFSMATNNADGRLIASGGGNGTIRLWDPVTGKSMGETLTGTWRETSARRGICPERATARFCR